MARTPKSAPAAAGDDLMPSTRRGRRKSERESSPDPADRADQLGEIAAALVALQASHDQLLAEVQGLRREVAKLRTPAVSRRDKPPAAGG